MIKKFSKINYGSYQNFLWSDSLPEFKKLNILYGRNYAGKTTLSRILRSFEIKEPHPDYPNATFEIELDNRHLKESNITDENKDLCIRVYNRDFVKENLSFLINDSIDGATIKAFSAVMLGQDNTHTKNEIGKLKKELGNESSDKEEASGLYKEFETLKAELNNFIRDKNSKDQDEQLREKARDIKANSNFVIQGTNYTITNIKSDIMKNIKEENNLAQCILSQEKQDEYRNIIKDEQKETINFQISFQQDNFSQIANRAKILIEKEIIAKESIESDLRKWLEKGLELHEHDKEKCKFCESPLSEKRFKWLIEHIKYDNSDKIELENKLKEWLNNFESYKVVIDNILPIKYNAFYTQIKDEFDKLKENLIKNVENYNKELEHIKRQILDKQDNVFENLQFDMDAIKDYSQDIQKDLQLIQKLCNKNNEKTQKLSDEQEKARECLRLNEVAIFVKDIKYFEIQAQIKGLDENITKKETAIKFKKDKIENTEKEIENLENSLSDEKAGADKANEYLRNFFGHNQLEFKSIPNKKGEFEIHRAGQIAKNLSEGECSLLAFCYFAAKLQDKDANDKKPIIWIDDPISSLDNNHIFFIFSLIDSEIAKSENYTQLFISTHNLEFLKYLKRLLKNKKQIEFFYIENVDKNSKIKQLSKYLSKYTTEFNYLFEQIYNFQNIENEQDEDKKIMLTYNFGNNLRKFLEIYLFFKYPYIEQDSSDSNKMAKFFNGSTLVASLVNRYQNEYSHLKDMIERGMKPIDIAESKKIAEFVIETIKTKDNEQFNALLKSIDKSGDINNA